MQDEAKELDTLRSELSRCVLSSSWIWCTAGVLASVPLCIRFKTYQPLVRPATLRVCIVLFSCVS